MVFIIYSETAKDVLKEGRRESGNNYYFAVSVGLKLKVIATSSNVGFQRKTSIIYLTYM